MRVALVFVCLDRVFPAIFNDFLELHGLIVWGHGRFLYNRGAMPGLCEADGRYFCAVGLWL